MIPIRDTVPSKNYPVVNTTLIAINVVVFFVQMSQGYGLERFIYTYGLVPARYSVPYILSHFTLAQQLFALISFMFLHGGFWHLLGNMWFLHIFGNNVEDRFGSFYYLIFYLLSGVISGLCHLLINYNSTVPTIGASGAIAGVMGAYLILYPNAKILTLIPVLIIPLFVEIPAFFFLGFWFILQVFNAAASDAVGGGIAWWAHIGGFVFGVFSLKLFNILPASSFAGTLKSASLKRKKTPRLQVLKPSGSARDFNLYEVIRISPYESVAGTKKMVNIPWGFSNRFYNVVIPAGTREGAILRLKGMGLRANDGQRGDLFLKVHIQ